MDFLPWPVKVFYIYEPQNRRLSFKASIYLWSPTLIWPSILRASILSLLTVAYTAVSLIMGLHWENYVSISFHTEWDIIVVTVFLSILNQMGFHLVKNQKENCHHDHIPFSVKGNGNIVFSVHVTKRDHSNLYYDNALHWHQLRNELFTHC